MTENSAKKDVLAKRLAGYAAAAGAMMGLSTNADGQVMYSGLVDTVTPLGEFTLDIDQNSVTDFVFTVDAGYLASGRNVYSYGFIDLYATSKSTYNPYSTNTNHFPNSFIDSNADNPAALNQGILVGNTLASYNGSAAFFRWDRENKDVLASNVFFVTTTQSVYTTTSGGKLTYTNTYSSSYQNGNFRGKGEKYLGTRFYIDNQLHYGWVRLETPANGSSLRIYDWAYQAVADSGIFTGDKVDMAARLSTESESYLNSPVSVNLDFNELAYGLELSDIEVINGTASDLAAVGPVKKDGGFEGWEFTFTVSPLAPGEVTVILPDSAVTDEFGQALMVADTVKFMWDIETSAPELSSKASIYPVPARNILHAEAAAVSDFALISADGRLLAKQTQTLKANFDLSAMKPGMLIVEVRNQQGVARYKVVKE